MSEFDTTTFNFGKCKTAQYEMEDGKWIVCLVDDNVSLKKIDEILTYQCHMYLNDKKKVVLNQENIFEVKANRFAVFEKKPTKRQIEKMFDPREHGTNYKYFDPRDE